MSENRFTQNWARELGANMRRMDRRWWALLALLAIAGAALLFLGSADEPSSMVAVPASSSELAGEDYKAVESRLKAAGFTSVETTAIADLVLGWLTKDGEVESVSIEGRDDFDAGSEFAPGAKIVITYHTFPPDEPQQTEESVPDPTAKQEPSEAPSDVVLTKGNSDELMAVLRAENPGDPEVQAFANKYAGRTIEFDGYVWEWQNHTSTSPFSGEETVYDTLYDTIIYVGDVKNADSTSVGPMFKVEGFSMPNYTPSMDKLNVTATAVVTGFDADHEFLTIELQSLEER